MPSIGPVERAATAAQVGAAPALPKTGASVEGADFGAALENVANALGGLETKADASSLALATGQPVDVHQVMLDVEQASIGMQLALQVRNKLVEAYQEIMRMNV